MKIQLFNQQNQSDLSGDLQKQVIASDNALMDFPWSAEHWQKIFEDFAHYHLLLMLDPGEKLMGFVLGTEDPDSFHLLKILVVENQRRQGLAQKLLDFLITWQLKQDKQVINLEVRISNTSAISFYQKNQFSTLHTRPKFYSSGETALLMQRNLAK